MPPAQNHVSSPWNDVTILKKRVTVLNSPEGLSYFPHSQVISLYHIVLYKASTILKEDRISVYMHSLSAKPEASVSQQRKLGDTRS